MILSRLFLSIALFTCFVLVPGDAKAQAPIYNQSQNSAPIPESACDPAYYESLKSRAWLEAQREITQNQNLIAKPDSVLAYSCFDQFTFELARATTNMFSETDRWDSASGSSLGNIFEDLIGTQYDIHLGQNYSKKVGEDYIQILRGGRGPLAPESGAMSAANSNPYNCRVMNDVWEAAKCANFFEKDHDGFFTLAEYKDGDEKRQLPEMCGRIASDWANHYIDAGLDNNTGPKWTEDKLDGIVRDPSQTPPVKTAYATFSDPAECGNIEPIETGLTVTRTQASSGPREFKEKICIQPGCYYKPTGLDSGCCTANPSDRRACGEGN